MACNLCGGQSGKYYLCFNCNKLKEEGKIAKCDDCGKEPRFKRYGEAWNAYWYCYDGWDGDSGFVCWKCLLKSKLRGLKTKMKKRIKQRKNYRKWIQQLKEKGVPITKEVKEMVKKICQ